MRFKVDEYVVRVKGREYSVLVFPFIKNMWAFNSRPKDCCYMVDAVVEAFVMLKYAMVILTEASDKIVYFPCKQEGIANCYQENYNLVLCTPKAQLRRSLWIAIRRKLRPANKKGSYVLQYNREKMDDFCRKNLMEKEWRMCKPEYVLRPEIRKKIKKEHLEEVIGENLFMVLGKVECYFNHYYMAKDLDEYCEDDEYGVWTAVGWIITSKVLADMKAKEKELKERGKNFE